VFIRRGEKLAKPVSRFLDEGSELGTWCHWAVVRRCELIL
jgi:hypothetical protein